MTSIKVCVLLERAPDDIHQWLITAASFDAAGADALWIELAPESGLDSLGLTAALAAMTHKAQLILPDPPSHQARLLDTVTRVSRGRLQTKIDEWLRVPVPNGREEWQAMIAQALEQNLLGVRVPADPKLIDLLRNPEDPGQRRDLELSVG